MTENLADRVAAAELRLDALQRSHRDHGNWLESIHREIALLDEIVATRAAANRRSIAELHTFIADLAAEIRATGDALADHVRTGENGTAER